MKNTTDSLERLPASAGSVNRCCAMTGAKWYRPEPTPCKLPAWKDGYCRKHHPVQRAKGIVKEMDATQKALKTAKGKVAFYKQKVERLIVERERWDAFISQNAKEISDGRALAKQFAASGVRRFAACKSENPPV